MPRVKKVSSGRGGSGTDWQFSQSPILKEAAVPANSPVSDKNDAITCPVCGAVAVQEKCKIICHSDTCRGRVIMNCSEF